MSHPYDDLINKIADYVVDYDVKNEETLKIAALCLLDTLGCGALALNHPACTQLLGPWVPGTVVPNGVKVPGTNFELDPIKAAFDISTLGRWLDYNDTWLAAEWGHPSDNLGAILACCDFVSRSGFLDNLSLQRVYTIEDVLVFMIKAHEIQGILALNNSFNQVGLDHVILVKIASSAIATSILGGTREQIKAAVSQAFVDGHSLRTYRHFPNTGSRKSWAAGDSASRGVQLAFMTLLGEKGYASVLTTPKWGFEDVLFKGNHLSLEQAFNTYVMDNILFKISYPAEFHGQTAIEATLLLRDDIIFHRKEVIPEDIKEIKISTQEAACRIIDKKGTLNNPADRDHCLQYMVSVALLGGEVTDASYEDDYAKDSKIDELRVKMTVTEDKRYSQDYLDPKKRAIPNRVEIIYNDGQTFEKEVLYPLGHRRRREEGIPHLIGKAKINLLTRYNTKTVETLISNLQNYSSNSQASSMLITQLMDSLSLV